MQFKLASLFSDNMVLQQEVRLPIWGWAPVGEKVTVDIAGTCAEGLTGADGRWLVHLPALKAGGPFELKANGEVRRNVLIGEVWVCSGQSNMDLPVCGAADSETEIAAAHYPGIRLFKVPQNATCEPVTDVDATWQVCSPATIASFSAVAYYFARSIQQKYFVPIGVIQSSWGSTPAEAWTSRETLMADPDYKKTIEDYELELHRFDTVKANYQAKMKAYTLGQIEDPANTGYAKGWAAPLTPTTTWTEVTVPSYWQRSGFNCNGVLWFRKEVDLPPAWAGKDLILRLGACDKFDMTYFNNVQVGSLWIDQPEAWCTPRVYRIPGHQVKAGRNTLAVRIYSHMWAGGFAGPAHEMTLTPDGIPEAIPVSLAGTWHCKMEHEWKLFGPPFGPDNPRSPCVLYNGMVQPLLPYAIRGVIWYQGERNVEKAYQYRRLFPALINDWRKSWNQGDFPFYFVQLANHLAPQAKPSESVWAELREAQLMTTELRNTGMAVTIDIGEEQDIHPKNKQDVGKRLALYALAKVYGHTLESSGPTLESAKFDEDHVRLTFSHLGGGLVAKGGELQGFSLAGEDRIFVWAQATIEGNTVVVTSANATNPVAVRYAWQDNPACTLYNQAGLPASPFRTDDWPGLTIRAR